MRVKAFFSLERPFTVLENLNSLSVLCKCRNTEVLCANHKVNVDYRIVDSHFMRLVFGAVFIPVKHNHGWIISFLNASAALFCGLGLGLSVAFRKKGKSKLSFAIQFLGVVAILFTVISYCVFTGNLLQTLN